MLAKSKIEPHQQISATYTIWFLLVYEIFDDTIGCNLDPFVDLKKNEEDDVAKKFVKVLENITKENI